MLRNISLQNLKSAIIIGVIGGIVQIIYDKYPLQIGWLNGYITLIISLITIYISMRLILKTDIDFTFFIPRVIVGTISFSVHFLFRIIFNCIQKGFGLDNIFYIVLCTFLGGLILSVIISALISLKRRLFNIV